MSTYASELHAAAVVWARRGVPVFPLRVGGKEPATTRGFKDATLDLDQIDAWWRANPRANVGGATGHGLWVLDVDGELGRASLEQLVAEYGPLPDTLTVETGGGGLHYFFAVPAGEEAPRNSAGKVAPGIDVRGRGGYVVLPPSVHPSGRTYEILVDAPVAAPPPIPLSPPRAQAAENRDPPTPLPLEPRRRGAVGELLRDTPVADDRVRFQGALEAADHTIRSAVQGTRNATLNAQAFALGGLWVHWGCDDESLFDSAVAVLEDAAQAAEQPAATARRAMAEGRAKPGPRPEDRPPPGRASTPGARDALARLDELVQAGDQQALLTDAEIRTLIARPGQFAGEVEAILLHLPHTLRAALRRLARREARAPARTDSEAEHRERRDQIRARISRENKDGQLVVVTTLGTAITVLQEDPVWRGKIRRNELSGIDHLGDRTVDLDVELEVAAQLEQFYYAEWPLPKVQNAIRRIGSEHPFHPVRDYLDGLPPWDGVPRISRLLPDYFGVSETAIDGTDVSELVGAYGRCLLISMVARALDPGCKVDQVLVLYGEQGALKSTGLNALVPDRRWFHDDAVPLHDDKRLGMILRGPWLVELAELASVARAEIEAVKSAITRTHDRYVPMFGRAPVEVPRGCVLVGTANPDSQDGRGAPEAGRRWWVAWIPPGSQTSPQRIAADRDQLFAEARAAYDAGERWYLNADLAEQQREDVGAYVESDEWSDALARFTAEWKGGMDLTGVELCYRATQVDLLRLTMSEQRRFGLAARAAGWRKIGGGRQGKRWRAPK